MKKFFVGLLKGLGYFGVYLLLQSAVAGVLGRIYTVWLLVKSGMQSGYIGDNMSEMLFSEQFLADSLTLTWLSVIVSGAITILIFMLIGNSKGRKGKDAIRWKKLPEGAALPPVLIGFGFNVIVLFLISVIPFPQSWVDAHNTGMAFSNVLGFIVLVLAAVIAAPIVEEITFRAFVYTRMKKGMPMWLAAVLSSVLFGVVHGNMIQGMYTFILAMMAVWMFERTKSVIAPILLHFGFNLVGVTSYVVPEEFQNQWGLVIVGVAVVLFVLGFCLFLRVPAEPEPEEPEEIVPLPRQSQSEVVLAPWEMEEQPQEQEQNLYKDLM